MTEPVIEAAGGRSSVLFCMAAAHPDRLSQLHPLFADCMKQRPPQMHAAHHVHYDIDDVAACSPCLKLKPVSKLSKAKPWLSVNVEPYGGGLWHTWFDRDLSVAGRVLVRTATGGLQHRLVRRLQGLPCVRHALWGLALHSTCLAPCQAANSATCHGWIATSSAVTL